MDKIHLYTNQAGKRQDFKIDDYSKKWKYYQQDGSCDAELLTSFDNIEDAFEFGRDQIIILFEECGEDNDPEYPTVFPITEYKQVDQDIIQEKYSKNEPFNDYEIYSIPSNENYNVIFISSTNNCISYIKKN